MTNKNPDTIEGLILQGIYDELLQLHRQVGELTSSLHKNGLISMEQARTIINMPRTEENT